MFSKEKSKHPKYKNSQLNQNPEVIFHDPHHESLDNDLQSLSARDISPSSLKGKEKELPVPEDSLGTSKLSRKNYDPKINQTSWHGNVGSSSGNHYPKAAPAESRRRNLFRKAVSKSFSSFFKNKDSSRATEEPEPTEVILEGQRIPLKVFEDNNEATQGVLTTIEDELTESDDNSLSSPKRHSLLLEDLVNEERNPILYREILAWERLKERGDNLIEILEEYPWHTANSIKSLFDAQLRQKVEQRQVLQIELIRTLCRILHVAFQNYLKQIKEKDPQAEAMKKFLCNAIKSAMRTDLFDEYPPFIRKFLYHDQLSLMPDTLVYDDSMPDSFYRKEFEQRASVQLRSWRFPEAKSYKGLLINTLTFLKDNIDLETYNGILDQLFELIVEVGMGLREINMKTSELLLDLQKPGQVLELKMSEEEKPKRFVALSTQLHMATNVKQEVIKKLVTLIHSEYLAKKLLHPDFKIDLPQCSGLESDIYFPEGSHLLIDIQKTIANFMSEHSKWFKVSSPRSGSVIVTANSRNLALISEGLANALKNHLMPSWHDLYVGASASNLLF